MTSDYFNDPLAFDEQIIAEKLGIYEYGPKSENDVNMNLKLALLEEELRTSQKQVDNLKKNKRENFVPNKHTEKCSCKQDWDVFDWEPSKKVLMFLIVILVVFCVLQYFTFKSEAKEMMELVYMMMKAQQMGGQNPLGVPNNTNVQNP